MAKEKTSKVCTLTDVTTGIRYKIISVEPDLHFKVFKVYVDDIGKNRRIQIKTSETIRYQYNKEELIGYVKNCLISEHTVASDDQFVCERDTAMGIDGTETYSPNAYCAEKTAPEKVRKNPDQNLDLSGNVCAQIEDLFKEWKEAQLNEPEEVWRITRGSSKNISKGHFRRDGIICEQVFAAEKVKVLFISAEANDDAHSALLTEESNTVLDYWEYYHSGFDSYRGKMKERLTEMYKIIAGLKRDEMSASDAAIHFAIMDINKRGGTNLLGDPMHVEYYCKYYARFIKKEIELIDPDVVAIIGNNLYQMDLHRKYLDAIYEGDRAYFLLNQKRVPILSLWQTSYYQGREEPLVGYEDNRIIGKQASRCMAELERFNWNRKVY